MPRPREFTEEHFEVRPSGIKEAGNGLYAKVHISEDDTIGYYTGEVIDEDEFHRPDRPFSAYVLWVTRKHIIIGEGPKANYTRYINHSDEPNAFLVISTRWKKARFEALRDIAPGEEIFFNYGDDYWEHE